MRNMSQMTDHLCQWTDVGICLKCHRFHTVMRRMQANGANAGFPSDQSGRAKSLSHLRT